MAFPKLLQRLFQNNGAGDKLNQDIIPEMNYLPTSGGTVNGSVTINGTTVPVSGSTETYKEGIKFGWGSEISQSRPNGLDIWAKRGDATTVLAIYGEKKDGDTTGDTPGIYLRAGDGTSSNSLRVSISECTLNDKFRMIHKTNQAGDSFHWLEGLNSNSVLCLAPFSNTSFVNKKSSSLFLSTPDYTGNAIPAGAFYLSAMDATTGSKSLVGKPDGTLTWCGQRVLTGSSAGLTVVAESYSANSWYRKYSDGWIEQWILTPQVSFMSRNKTLTWVTFPVAFTSTFYWTIAGERQTSYRSYDSQESGDSNVDTYEGLVTLTVNKTGITGKSSWPSGSDHYNPVTLPANKWLYVCGK
nr:MAG TPA: hypothetical protein [Caudoviricetes sp.]